MGEDVIYFEVGIILLEMIFLGINYIFRINMFMNEMEVWNLIFIMMVKDVLLNVR